MPKIATPTLIPAYSSDTEDVYIFSIALVFDSCILDPVTDLDYDVQIDVQSNFGSPNLISLRKHSPAYLVNFQEGNTTKVFEVRLPRRIKDQSFTWYWRARVNNGLYISDWAATQTLTVPAQTAHAIAAEAHNNLADSHFYAKEAESSYIFRLFKSGGDELDQVRLETQRSKEDTFLDSVRDSAIQNNFGELYLHLKAVTESFGDYRNRIRMLRDSFLLYPATQQGIENMVESFVVQSPLITDNSDIEGWILGQNYLFDAAHPELQPYAILYSRVSRGFGFTIRIFNSWGITYDSTVLETLVKRIMPRHAKAVFQYPTQKPSAYCVNIAADWNTGTFVNTEVSGDYLKLSGTAIAPDFDYQGTSLPDAYSPAWPVTGIPVSESVAAGVLTLTATDAFYQSSGTTAWNFGPLGDNARLNTTMQVVTAPSYLADYPFIQETYTIVASVYNSAIGGTVSIGIRFYSDGIYIEGSGFYAINTTVLHTYGFVFRNTQFELWVDGTLASTLSKGWWGLGDPIGARFGVTGAISDVTVKITNIQVQSSSGSVVSQGSWESPVIDGKTVNSWDMMEGDPILNSGDIAYYELRSSASASGPFSSYEIITNNSIPITTPIQRYFQIKIILNAYGIPRPEMKSVIFNYWR